MFSNIAPFFCSDTLEAIEFLKSTEALDCVEKMIEAARANGVIGVPFIIIDEKWALNGVQPRDCYIQVSVFFCHVHPRTSFGRFSESWHNHPPFLPPQVWPRHATTARIQSLPLHFPYNNHVQYPPAVFSFSLHSPALSSVSCATTHFC